MRKLFGVLVALALFSMAAVGQTTSFTYYVPLTAVNTTDTIPGTHSAGANGKAGWLKVNDDYVSVAFVALDSTLCRVVIDYADSAYEWGTGRSARSVPFRTLPTAVTDGYWPGTTNLAFASWTAVDSLANIANEANPQMYRSRVLRDESVDFMPGGKWIRFRVFVPNTADKLAATTSDQQLRIVVNQRPKRR